MYIGGTLLPLWFYPILGGSADLSLKRLPDGWCRCLELGRVAAALGEVLLSAAAAAHRLGDLLDELADMCAFLCGVADLDGDRK